MAARYGFLVLVRHSMPHMWHVASAVRDYVRQHPGFRLQTAEANDAWLETIERGRPDGVIGFFLDSQAEQIAALKVPVINVSTQLAGVCPRVVPDHDAIGVLAADHLLEAGRRRFLFASFQHEGFARLRYEGFRRRLAEAGYSCERFVWSMEDPDALRRFRQAITEPIGVCTADDGCAIRLSQDLDAIGVAVPQHVAIVSVNNEEQLCELAPVPLSSIDLGSDTIGWRAAEMLHARMKGVAVTDCTVPPRGVVQRASSQPAAPDDPPVDFALRFIRDHACDGMTVNDIMEHLPVSRRTLEKRFHARFGRTLLDEIRRVRLLHAQRLLTETDMLIVDIAMRCGYRKHSAFSEQFSQHLGVSPLAYRRRRSPQGRPIHPGTPG